jgi:adenosylmethionine-8-amino-7-oxononanoate aminotransferase
VHLQGQRLEKSLRDLFDLHEHVGDIRGRGLFYALEFLQDRERKTPFDPGLQVHERVKVEALQRGLAIYPTGGIIDGRRGDHVLIAPAYICEGRDIESIVERLGDAVDPALQGL